MVLVTVLGCIASEKVAKPLAVVETPVALEAGLIDLTVGFVWSTITVRGAEPGEMFPHASVAVAV